MLSLLKADVEIPLPEPGEGNGNSSTSALVMFNMSCAQYWSEALVRSNSKHTDTHYRRHSSNVWPMPMSSISRTTRKPASLTHCFISSL